jgi:hypothetical protein
MSDSTQGNSPAFPEYDFTKVPAASIPGLTKREYFAAMAMQALVSTETADYDVKPKDAASFAVEYADCLIRELEN